MDDNLSRRTRPSDIDLSSKPEYNISDERNTKLPEEKDYRSPFERDRDKILYSRNFRRLKDVTQVARAGETYLHHDRLTHSIKVAQVGRRLSELLRQTYEGRPLDPRGYLDEDVVEAASLAHDLGHPPFGHLSEELLDDLVRANTCTGSEEYQPPEEDNITEDADTEGFEGNAQSFRTVTRIAARDHKYDGMDLTRATLNAIQKYPWSRGEDVESEVDSDNKWGYYESDRKYFDFAREPIHDERDQTLEAEVMDFADDVTYAVHDVDDFYRDGLLPLDQLLRNAESLVKPRTSSIDDIELDEKVDEAMGTELRGFIEYVDQSDKLECDGEDVVSFFLSFIFEGLDAPEEVYSPYEGTRSEREALNSMVSSFIGRYLEPTITDPEERDVVWLEEGPANSHPTLSVDPDIRREIEILKQLTFYYVISNPTLASQQRGQQRVIVELFESLYEEADPETVNQSAIPRPHRESVRKLDDVDDPERARVVADLIASLTEPQALKLHSRLRGDSPGSLQDTVVR